MANTRYSWGGLAFPFSGGARAVGLHLGTFGFKDQPEYTVDLPDGTGGVYSVSESYIGLTYAENFSDRFSAGITAKGVFDQLGEVSGSAFAVDFGTNFHSALNNHPIKFSFVIQNLGSNLSYSGDALNVGVPREPAEGEDPVPSNPQPGSYRTKAFALPTTFTVAVAYDIIAKENTRWTLLADFNQPNNTKAGYVFGTEFAFPQMGGSNFNGAVRGSYSYASANADTDVSGSQLNEEAELPGHRHRRRPVVHDRNVQPRVRLRLEVHGHSRLDQLLHVQHRLVTGGCDGGGPGRRRPGAQWFVGFRSLSRPAYWPPRPGSVSGRLKT